MRKLIVIEPSKTGLQHISFLRNYLCAIHLSPLFQRIPVEFHGARSTIENLQKDESLNVIFKIIPVVPSEMRRLVLKSLVEFFSVARLISLTSRDEQILVTYMLPPALMLLEVFCKIFAVRRVHVVLHGEIEHLADNTPQGVKSIFFWSRGWLRLRRLLRRPLVKLLVIDEFIAENLQKQLRLESQCLEHPIVPVASIGMSITTRRVCFVGFNTPKKGYRDFELLAEQVQDFSFVAIGGGVRRDLNCGRVLELESYQDYLSEIAVCEYALFLYNDGYSLTLSAAALDALSVGTPLLCLRRPFFESLAHALGEDSVRCFDNIHDLREFVASQPTPSIDDASLRQERLERLAQSRYSLREVGLRFEQYFLEDYSATHSLGR